MKKLFTIFAGLCITFLVSGCSAGDLLDKFIPVEETEETRNTEVKTRVYMDETTGTLLDFDGTYLTIEGTQEESYVFDVSQATLECEDGMIAGDEVSIIYEGQLINKDTSTVKALKVVDEYHKKVHLEDRTIHGTLQNLTPNTVTIKSEKGNLATYPITGTEQYYQNGLTAGQWVYLHFKGKFPPRDTPGTLNASHMKVLTISDIEPMQVPTPTLVPARPADAEASAAAADSTFRAVIQDIQLNSLKVRPKGSKTSVTVNLSGISCYFKGGIAPGSLVTIHYQGEFNGTTLDGISISSVIGEDTDSIKESSISSTVTGTIVGSTANTVTIKTTDGAIITCSTDNTTNSSTGGLLTGSNICVTFNPSVSKTSNIYKAIKITDA
ncbi:MAG: hypothetical protein SPE99_01690 [Blautia sp.]|nr:hypothetical protein [Blautia sp.]MDY5021093.1 hypothetical protein [Blautia sp.]